MTTKGGRDVEVAQGPDSLVLSGSSLTPLFTVNSIHELS